MHTGHDVGKAHVKGKSAATSRSAAEEALHRLVTLPEARYEELLAVPAEHALEFLRADAVSLSRWERDRGLLRTLVNVGELQPGEHRFPRDETYEVYQDEAIARVVDGLPAVYPPGDPAHHPGASVDRAVSGGRTGLSAPVFVDGRLWGELWALRADESVGPESLDEAVAVAAELSGMIAVAEKLQRMTRMAFEDPLTRVGNRRALDDGLAELLADDGPGATIVMCDVDNLKQINDEHGHDAGDRTIVAVADALAAAAAEIPGSVVVRIGGDEFAVLLRGAVRARALDAVEAAARRLSDTGLAVGISCGVAVVRPGVPPRDALAAVDDAQYAAKSRGALLVVAADVTEPAALRRPETTAVRSRGRRRSVRPVAAPAGDMQAAVAEVVTSLAGGLSEVPNGTRSRLGWLAERLLVPFGLEHWSTSRVELAGERFLRVSTMGVRHTRAFGIDQHDLHVDTSFRIDDYPVSRHAIESDRWFSVSVDDSRADESERRVLREMGMHSVVALGCRDGDTGWLLEVYSRSPELDVTLLGSILSVSASALLGRLVTEVDTDVR